MNGHVGEVLAQKLYEYASKCALMCSLNISLQCLNAILIAFIRVTVYYCQYTKMNGHVVKILKYHIL